MLSANNRCNPQYDLKIGALLPCSKDVVIIPGKVFGEETKNARPWRGASRKFPGIADRDFLRQGWETLAERPDLTEMRF
jgi:hypothetical protein